jgi:hypothetical protein
MKLVNSWLPLALACYWPGVAPAQLQLLPDKETPCVFAGEGRPIAVVWRNAGESPVDADIRTRLYQTTSATSTPLSETTWKKMEILPGQTVLETARMDFPEVRAETAFLIQWLKETNHVIGLTEVRVFPTNLLDELGPLLGEAVAGVLDPNNELRPLLKRSRVNFLDLSESPLEDFRGKFAVIGPFQSKTQMRGDLTQSVRKMAGRGAAVVWMQPPPEPGDELKPSFYVVPEGKGTVVVVQSALVAALSESPRSQLNLIYFSKLALNPKRFSLPDSNIQP